jgi:hypothetical protein
MRKWLYWHFPVITTRYKQSKIISEHIDSQVESAINIVEKIGRKSAWAAINPIIHDLESLRADTWNQDKITKIQDWLRDNFEVRDEESIENK